MSLELKVIGPYTGPTGYDHHVREFVRELVKQGVFVELVDFPEWGPARLPREMREPWFETLTTPSKGRTVLHFKLPERVEPEPGRLNVDFTMFEATRIPAHWAEANRSHDLVILPTESSRQAWLNSGVPEEKLRICPLGVSTAFLRDGVPPLKLQGESGRNLNDYRIRFLNVSEIGPRKNLRGLLTAWLRATTPADDAVLVLKLGAYQPGSSSGALLALQAAEHDAGKAMDQAARIHFHNALFPDADLPRLFAFATHYISLSFGEGWDLSMAEAAASGLKLIAPDHSAYRTYLTPEIATLLPSTEVTAEVPGNPNSYFAGANWWHPDPDSAVRAIRDAIDGVDDDKKSPRFHIAEHFTWQKATERLIQVLSDFERQHP